MKRSCKAAALAAACSLLALPLAPAAQQARPASVGTGIVQALSSVDDVLAQAGREANYAVFAAAAELRLLIQRFQLDVRGALGAPPSGLSAPERQRFERIQQAVGDLQKAASLRHGEAREALTSVRQLARDAAPAGGEAQLLAVTPSVLAPSSADAAHLTLRGVSLDRSGPRLFLGNTEAGVRTVTSQQAVFSIPVQALGFSDAIPIVRAGRVLLDARTCTWLVFCGRVPREYPVALLLLPRRLASVQITFNRTVKQRVYEKFDARGAADAAAADKIYSRTFDYTTDDLTLLSCNTVTQAPHASGYLIDTDSLSLTVKSSAGETRARIAAASPAGFTVELCAQARISRLMKTSGAISVQATWKEYQMADVVQHAESLAAQPLTWGSSIETSLPPDTSAIAVQVDYFDGSHGTYTGDASDELIELTWDRARQQLRLAARDAADIEGIN
jgi:hypothetical protein